MSEFVSAASGAFDNFQVHAVAALKADYEHETDLVLSHGPRLDGSLARPPVSQRVVQEMWHSSARFPFQGIRVASGPQHPPPRPNLGVFISRGTQRTT